MLAQFDVASIKPNASGRNGGSMSGGGGSTGRITMENVPLRDVIAFAYSLPSDRTYQLLGPDWIDSEHFDISATFRAGISRDAVRAMVQSLLVTRFGLQTHYEERNVRVFALVVAKGGPKLQAHTDPDAGGFFFGEDHVNGRAASLSGLADRLSSPYFKLDRPVVDRTGVAGVWDFKLAWATDASGPSLFTALEEQLGLKLEAQTAATRILIVDQVSKEPTAN